MKIAFYQDGVFAVMYEGIEDPSITGDELHFANNGLFKGLENAVLLKDEDEAPETFEEAQTMNQMSLYMVQKHDEVADLKARLEQAEMAIITLMDFM